MFKIAEKVKRIRIDKKVYIAAGLVLLLGFTIYLNVAFGKSADELTGKVNDDTEVVSGNFFVDFRTNREKTRKQELTDINEVIANANTDAATLATAQQMKLALSSNMEKELIVEGMLIARGFSDAVVTISGESVNVVIKADALTTEEAARVYETVTGEINVKAENVKILKSA